MGFPVSTSIKAVSYTHLDVYKRQAYMNAAVTINHEMITYAAQSALAVPAVNIRYGEVRPSLVALQ